MSTGAAFPNGFTHTRLGKLGTPVFRLGLSATYRPGKQTLYKALDAGVNYFFCFGIDTQMIRVLREVLPRNREKYVVATGAYNYVWGHQNLARTLEKRLRQLRTDYIDAFLFLGVARRRHFPEPVREELARLRETGKVRGIGISTHDRKLAGELAAQGALDVMMVRYNAAHRGAETQIFPYLDSFDPGIVSFTATRWTRLLRRPRRWPGNGPVPTAGQCYRFVLSNPHVDVCMTAPTNLAQLEDNLSALDRGPLDAEEMKFLREFGDAVHREVKWFM